MYQLLPAHTFDVDVGRSAIYARSYNQHHESYRFSNFNPMTDRNVVNVKRILMAERRAASFLSF